MKTPLYFALRERRFVTARWLLEHGANVVRISDIIESDNLEAIELLFEFDYRFNDDSVCWMRSLEMAKLLAKHGYTKPGANGASFFVYLLNELPSEIADFYIANGFNLSGYSEQEQRKFILHFDINFLRKFVESLDKSPLAAAAMVGCVAKMRLFYSRDRLDEVDLYQRNALANYIEFNRDIDPEIVKMLRPPNFNGHALAMAYVECHHFLSYDVFELLFDDTDDALDEMIAMSKRKQADKITQRLENVKSARHCIGQQTV